MVTTVTIAELITDTIPETERLLLDSTKGDTDYTNAKKRAIALATVRTYGSEVTEASITNLEVREYIANLALYERIIPFAMDWIGHKTRLSDTKEGATITWHNLVDALSAKRDSIGAWLRSRQTHITEIVSQSGENGAEAAMDISTRHTDFSTYKTAPTIVGDPWENARWR